MSQIISQTSHNITYIVTNFILQHIYHNYYNYHKFITFTEVEVVGQRAAPGSKAAAAAGASVTCVMRHSMPLIHSAENRKYC